MDDKTVLFDTVEKTHSHQFLENIRFVLQNKPLDYVIVHHMEPDHSSTLLEIIHHYPQVKVICNEKILKMIHQYFDLDLSNQVVLVQEGQLERGEFLLSMSCLDKISMATGVDTDFILYGKTGKDKFKIKDNLKRIIENADKEEIKMIYRIVLTVRNFVNKQNR